MTWKAIPRLSLETHNKIIECADLGWSKKQIAGTLRISPYAIDKHLENRNESYPGQATVQVFHQPTPMKTNSDWMPDVGFFWFYFNTRSGRPPGSEEQTEAWKIWKASPWIIRKFSGELAWNSSYPMIGTFTDTLATDVRASEVSFETVYFDSPPWKNQRTSIKWVRGFIKVKGVIEYRVLGAITN